MIQRDGLWWPDGMTTWKSQIRRASDLTAAIDRCAGRSLAVQAGGNVGVWPIALSRAFRQVVTAEPEPSSAACLRRNVAPHPTIAVHEAALGNRPDRVGLAFPDGPSRFGSVCVSGSGAVPMVRIDDWQLAACDLIQLDIEGHEPLALEGAAETIGRYRPVLMLEDKGHSERVGVPKGWTAQVPGYQVAARIREDVILVPC